MTFMPGVASLEDFQRAVDEFDITSSRLTIEPAALAAGRQSLDQSGLLLLGEVHGVRQNPLLARALMAALEVTGLALEWPAELAAAVSGFFTDGRVPDHPHLWGGDGRITAGHFALLRERFLAGRLRALTLFDGVSQTGWSQSRIRDGRAHTQRPGTRRSHAGSRGERAHRADADDARRPARSPAGRVAARGPRDPHQVRQGHLLQPGRRSGSTPRSRFGAQARVRAEGGSLLLDLPAPAQAWVPHRTAADAPPAKPSPAGYTGAFAAYRDPPRLAPPEPAAEPGYPRLPRLPAPGGPAGAPGCAADASRPAGSAPLPRRRANDRDDQPVRDGTNPR